MLLAAIVRQNWNDEDWNQAFQIYTWHAHQNQIHQPLAGHYHVEGMVVYFTPLFPFAAGETYYAALDYGMIWKKSGSILIADKSYESSRNHRPYLCHSYVPYSSHLC